MCFIDSICISEIVCFILFCLTLCQLYLRCSKSLQNWKGKVEPQFVNNLNNPKSAANISNFPQFNVIHERISLISCLPKAAPLYCFWKTQNQGPKASQSIEYGPPWNRGTENTTKKEISRLSWVLWWHT